MISSRREGNINKQTKLKFLDTRSSISQSASTCLPMFRRSGSVASGRSGLRRDFLSNRKYRYRPYTQADVGNCWPCFTVLGHFAFCAEWTKFFKKKKKTLTNNLQSLTKYTLARHYFFKVVRDSFGSNKMCQFFCQNLLFMAQAVGK